MTQKGARLGRWPLRVGVWLIGGGIAAHVAPRIHGCVVQADFVMHVGASGAAADACVAEHFAGLDACAGDDRIGRKMSVPGGDAKPMIEDDDWAITGVLTNVKHHVVGSGVDSDAIVLST